MNECLWWHLTLRAGLMFWPDIRVVKMSNLTYSKSSEGELYLSDVWFRLIFNEHSKWLESWKLN